MPLAAFWVLLTSVFSLQLGSSGSLGCHRPHLSTITTRIRNFVMQFDVREHECKDQNYTGSLYGVTAKVVLNLKRRQAHVRLHGIAVGGRIQGVGRLVGHVDAEEGGVELEEEFEQALARRFVTIQGAKLDRPNNRVLVEAVIPFFGQQTIVLLRD